MEKIKHFLAIIILSFLSAPILQEALGEKSPSLFISTPTDYLTDNLGFYFAIFFWALFIRGVMVGSFSRKYLGLLGVILGLNFLLATELGMLSLLSTLAGALLGLALHPLRRKYFKA